jgi:hypothetical protein
VVPYHADVEMLLLLNGTEAVATLHRIMNGQYPQLELIHAAMRAAVAVLERCCYGPLSRSRKATKAA